MMKRIVIIFCMMIGLICLSSCNEAQEVGENVVKVYYLNNDETKIDAYDYQMQSTANNEQLKELLDCLGKKSAKSEYKAPLDYGFEILDAQVRRGTLFINVDAAYQDLEPITEVLIRAAIVSTVTQIENINNVSMTVQGKQLYDSTGESVGRMSANQFIYNDGNEINAYELVRVKLYFANKNGDKLIAAYREKHYSTNISLERFIVEELISGPSGQVSELYPAINPSTKLLGVTIKDNICYVNLDASFLEVVNNVPVDLAKYSIVNSLVELSNVNKVQILIDGEVPSSFETAILERNLDCVTTVELR